MGISRRPGEVTADWSGNKKARAEEKLKSQYGITSTPTGYSNEKWLGVMDSISRGAEIEGINKNVRPLSPAEVAQEQYDYYQNTFVPIERGLMGEIRSPEEINALSRNAGIGAYKTGVKAKAQFGRAAGRMGIQLSADQQQEADQLLQRAATGGIGGAITRTRSGLYDQNLENMGNIVALGRNLATSSQDTLSNASANITQTQNANKQLKAQQQAETVSLVGTLGMLGYLALSDRALKENLIPLYRDKDGLYVYGYNYKDDPNTRYIGRMAQDIIQVAPDAVFLDPNGHYRVANQYRPVRVSNHG